MLNIAILTGVRRGYASRSIPLLCKSPKIKIAAVILSNEILTDKKKFYKRKFKKAFEIGLLGAINGIRIRKWFVDDATDDIEDVAKRENINLYEVSNINCDETRKILKETNVDLGLSLGNSYISSKVFSIPQYGMINIHTELLPDYKGGLSIIWPIYEGKSKTGFTIHQIDEGIDTGNILYRAEYEIRFYPTLKETVVNNLKEVRKDIPEALCHVCDNYRSLTENTTRQKAGNSYTTPTMRQFCQMISKNRQMYSAHNNK